MRIGLDIMGGDYAPQECLKAAISFSESQSHVTLVLFGNENNIDNFNVETYKNIEFVHCNDIIEMNEHPTKALKEKPNSSIVLGFQHLATEKIDAFISAGNTGAMLIGAAHIIKPIHGVSRPTISTVIPTQDGNFNILLDVGLNADCKPEHLNQFSILGSLFVQHIFDVQEPKVGLLNIGEEEGKGNILAQNTYPLLKNNEHINFIGNIEGRDILSNKANVIVCEGFLGNVILKFAESMYEIFAQQRQIKDDYINRFNYELYGGTPILGINKPVIVGHGISKASSFIAMMEMAKKLIDTELCEKMRLQFENLAE